MNDCGLPRGVWPFVFPPLQRLPHLTCLSFYAMVDARGVAPSSAWDAADVCALVRCCPNLIEIPHIGLQLGSHVSELHKLMALTSLQVLYGDGSLEAVRESVKGLATITQLQSLTLGAEFRVGDLLPLTSLTALTSLTRNSYYPGNMEPNKSDLRTQVKLQTCPSSCCMTCLHPLSNNKTRAIGRSWRLSLLVTASIKQLQKKHPSEPRTY